MKNYKTVLLALVGWVFLGSVATAEARNLIIIRHGQAESNIKGVINSSVETSLRYPLTEKGKEQLRATAKRLKEKQHLDGKKVGAIYYSPLFRTYQSASIIRKELGVDSEKMIPDESLVEIGVGDLDEKPVKLLHKYVPDGKSFKASEVKPFHGETGEALKRRLTLFLDKIKTRGISNDIIVVTHGTPAAYLISLLEKSDSIGPDPANAEEKVLEY